MTRDKKIEIRLTQEEAECIENICMAQNISKSEFIRRAIRGGCDFNMKYIAQKIYTVQSILNKMASIGITDDEAGLLMKEVDELWQYLN